MSLDEPNPAPSRRQLQVHFLPELAHPHELAGNEVVVVDVLRASTTIVTALDSGASQILPCLEVPEARRLAKDRQAEGLSIRLGGERGGEPIRGFDFGNSPLEYTAEAVSGETLVFTTTNGTRAMMRCVGAGRVLIGAFVNLTALAGSLKAAARADILCAGTDGEPSFEDILFAGALVERLLAADGELEVNDAARLAHSAWNENRSRQLAEVLRQGQGGTNLLALGREADIDFAARVDEYRIVPELDQSDWMIRIPQDAR